MTAPVLVVTLTLPVVLNPPRVISSLAWSEIAPAPASISTPSVIVIAPLPFPSESAEIVTCPSSEVILPLTPKSMSFSAAMSTVPPLVVIGALISASASASILTLPAVVEIPLLTNTLLPTPFASSVTVPAAARIPVPVASTTIVPPRVWISMLPFAAPLSRLMMLISAPETPSINSILPTVVFSTSIESTSISSELLSPIPAVASIVTTAPAESATISEFASPPSMTPRPELIETANSVALEVVMELIWISPPSVPVEERLISPAPASRKLPSAMTIPSLLSPSMLASVFAVTEILPALAEVRLPVEVKLTSSPAAITIEPSAVVAASLIVTSLFPPVALRLIPESTFSIELARVPLTLMLPVVVIERSASGIVAATLSTTERLLTVTSPVTFSSSELSTF